MNLLPMIVLALIQGAAELLPVSSSAHVIVAEKLMGLDPSSPKMTFLLVMLHTGTMFAVLVYFWSRWRQVLAADYRAPEAGPPGTRRSFFVRYHFLVMIFLATACTGILGLGLKLLIEKVVLVGMLGHRKGEIETLFKSLPLIAAALFLVGIFIILAGSRERRATANTVTARSALWIGLVQGLCLPFRGFSRSGATISTALYRGMARPLAEEFSFALAVVLTPAVIVLEVKRLLEAETWSGLEELAPLLLPGLLGMVFSFLAGLAALRLLSAALEKGAWKYFGYYCLAAALGVVAVWQMVD